MAIIPPPLSTNSKLAVISPAGPVDPEKLELGVSRLESKGFKVIIMPNVLAKKDYLAGDDDTRYKDLFYAFTDKTIDGIVCSRGGYGSMRILARLSINTVVNNPKVFVGFSDITALQWALWKRIRLVTFSGPQVARGWGEGMTTFSENCWLDMLKGNLWGKSLPLPTGTELLTITKGNAEGRLLGGNLSMLAALCGTDEAPMFKNSILLIEDLNEPLYRIDRMITQLHLSGALSGVRGVILGRFFRNVNGNYEDQQIAVAGLISEVLPGIPLIGNAPYGHVDDCWTIPLGSWTTLDADNGTIVVEAKE